MHHTHWTFSGRRFNVISQPNATATKIIRDLRLSSVQSQSIPGKLIEDANYYFAFVPDLSNQGNASALDDGVVVLPTMRLQQLEKA